MADLGRDVKAFPSSSTAGKFYTVKEKEGVLSCNCPPWIFNRNGNRTCKHTEICRKELGLAAPAAVAKIVPAKKAMPTGWVHPMMKGKVSKTVVHKVIPSYKEVFVGQLWIEGDNESKIKVLELGKDLQKKYPKLCFTDAQHGLNEGFDVLYDMDGEKSIDDYIQFLDFTFSNCYEPNEKAPTGKGEYEPVYKREEDEVKSPHNDGPEHYCPECKEPECEAKPLTDAELKRAVRKSETLDIIAPMLASKGEPLKILQIAESSEWVAERKLDGSRYGLYIGKEGNRLLSKHISVKDDKPVDKTENVPHLTHVATPELDGTVIDGEITTPNGDFGNVVSVMGSHPFEAIEKQKKDGNMLYTVFDCPRYKGEDITKRTLRERQEILKRVIKTLGNPAIRFIEQRSENRMEWFKQIVKEGGEGIILKRWESQYEPGKRGPQWVKVKKMQTYDVVVMGFKETKSVAWQAQGLIGAVIFGCYNAQGKLQEVGDTSGMTLEVRRDMSANPDKWIGIVVEVAGQEVLRDAIRHPRYIRTRPDVAAKTCTIKKLMES